MLLILLWIGLRLDWHGFGNVFARVSWLWFAGAVLFAPSLVFMLSRRIQILLGAQQLYVPFLSLLRMTWAGQFFNTFLPGATGGDFFKMFHIGQLTPHAHSKGAAAIVLDRLSAVVGLAILTAAAFTIEPEPIQALARNSFAFSGAAAAAGAVLLVAAAALWLTGLGNRVAFAKAVAWATATHTLSFSVVWALSRGLHLNLSYLQVLTMMPVVLFVVLLPLSINGHGLRELVMIGYFRFFRVGPDPVLAAVALSLTYVATDFITALPGGIIYLLLPRPDPSHETTKPRGMP
jgi:uncharacterized membrane protein YbhN (UPF0104 family)